MKNLLTLNIIFLFLCVLGLTSCSKSNVEEKITQTNTIIQFAVSGITDVDPSATTMKKRDNAIIQNPIQHVIYKDFETLNYYKEGNSTHSVGKKMATTTMESGVKYRVEIFEKNGATEKHWRTLNLTSNTLVSLNDTVGVVYGKTYKWYAYSYNTSDVINVAPQSLDIPMGNNKDFLYASNELTISQFGNSSVKILFQRKTARIAIDIDTRGINADNISNLQVTFPVGIAKTGNFHLKNQTVSTSDLGIQYLTFNTANFLNIGGPYRKVAYIHSAQAISLLGSNSVSLGIPTITFNVANNLTGPTNTTTRTITSSTFNFSNVSINVGASGSLKADFLHSGILYGGLTWAPANLYRHDQTSTHRYRFYPHNNQTTDFRTLFSFRGYVPLQLATRTATPIDGCSLVYPYGRWKTPANSDFSTANMVTSSGLVGNVLDLLIQILLGNNAPNSYADFNSVLPNNRMGYLERGGLVFPLNGYLPNLSVLNVPTSLDDAQPLLSMSLFQTFTSTGGLVYNSGHLWTFDSTVDISLGSVINVTTVGAQHYLALTYPQRGTIIVDPEDRKAVTTTDLLNVSLLNNTLGIISSSFKNVRCIRNTAWNPNATGYNPDIDYNNLPRTYSKQNLIDLGLIL